MNMPRVDGQELARHGFGGHLRLDVVGDAIELPSQRVGNHRDRFGQPDVAHAAIVHLLLELFAGQAGADLLLERSLRMRASWMRSTLIASTRTPVSMIGSASMTKARIHAGPEHGHLGLLRHLMHGPRVAHVALGRIGQLLGRRHDRPQASGSTRSGRARPSSTNWCTARRHPASPP